MSLSVRPERRGRRGPRLAHRWLQRTGCVAAAALLFTAYGTGVSWGHWTLTAYAEATVGTGDLEVDASDPPDLTFDCTSQTYPGQAISFVRFWDPDYPPGQLVPAKPGAVKIEEDGVEFGHGDYWVEPPGAVIGDPLTVHIGDVTVRIVSWVPKPGEPGEWAAFQYVVSEGDQVTVDVKAGQSLTRAVLSGSGVWTSAGLIPGGEAGECTCDPSSQTARLDFANTGSIPATVSLRWILGSWAYPAACSFFDVVVKDGPSGTILFQGSLCDLLGAALPVSPQLDPGGTTGLDVTVSVRDGECPADDITLPLSSDTTFWQWTSSAPGSPDSYGWWDTLEGPFQVRLSVTAQPCESATVLGGLFAEAAALFSEEPGVPPEEPAPITTTTTTTLPPPEEPITPSPPPEEPTTTTTTLPLPEEPVLLTLQGRVWEDQDGDGVTVTDPLNVLPDGFEVEPAVEAVQVTLWAGDGTWVGTTSTDEEGLYEFTDLEPGIYRVEFEAPEGFGFRDPDVGITVEAEPVAAGLGIPVEQVVFDDLHLAPEPGEGELARAETAFFALDEVAAGDGGDTDGLADAALLRLPDPEEEPSDEGTGGEEVPPPVVDPNTQASQPEEPGLQPPDGDGSGDGGDGTTGEEEPPPDDGGSPGEGEETPG